MAKNDLSIINPLFLCVKLPDTSFHVMKNHSDAIKNRRGTEFKKRSRKINKLWTKVHSLTYD